MADEQIKVVYDVDIGDVKAAETAVESLKNATDQAAAASGKMEDASKKAGKGAADFGRTALETGRIAQDFAQGGIGGIINNLEGFARALGGGPGLAGVATLAGVAFLTLRKPVGDFLSTLIDGSNQVPQATDALARMNEQLDTSKTRLKELAKQQTLTNAELAEYKRLGAEVLEQEKATNAERERRNALEAQRKKEAAPDAESQKAVSDAVKQAGGVDKVTADLAAARPGATNAAQAQLDQLTKERDAALGKASSPNQKADVNARYRQQIAEAQATRDKAASDAKAGASDIVAKALQGDQGAIRDLDRSVPGRGFDRATTENVAAQKAALAAGEEQAKRDREWRAAQDRQNAERRAMREKDDKEQADAEKFRGKQDLEQSGRIERMKIDRQDMDRKAAKAEQDRQDAILGQFYDAQGKDQVDALASEMERATNGGFTSAEGQQLATGNQALRAAGQGLASPDQLQKIIQQNDAMMRSLGDAGGDGSGAMSAFMQQQQQLLWALGKIREMDGNQQRWRQMQPINGTLLSRGGG